MLSHTHTSLISTYTHCRYTALANTQAYTHIHTYHRDIHIIGTLHIHIHTHTHTSRC